MHRDDFAHDKPPSRGQWRAIAEAFLAFHDEPGLVSRADATTMLARLEAAIADAITTAPIGGNVSPIFGLDRGGPDGHVGEDPGAPEDPA